MGKRAPAYSARLSQTNPDPGSPLPQTVSTPKEGKSCHFDQPNKDRPYSDPATPSPSKPIMIPSKRRLAPPGKLTKEDILKKYPGNFEGLGCLGPPVHFEVKADVSPVQMPIHRVPVAKRIKEKKALDRYTAARHLPIVLVKVAYYASDSARFLPKLCSNYARFSKLCYFFKKLFCAQTSH